MLIEKEFGMWLPIIAGIATREEVECATAEQLAIWCAVASKKIELMGGGSF